MSIKTKKPFWLPFALGVMFSALLLSLYFFVTQLLLIPVSFDQADINLPSSAENKTTETPNINLIEIMVTQEGKYFVNGKVVKDEKPETLFRGLTQILNGIDEASPPLEISADAKASYQSVVTVMDIVGRLGITNFSMATLDENNK